MNNKWIVCSGPDWYRPSMISTKQYIWKFFRDEYRILWVNPIPFKSPFVNSQSKLSVFNKIRDKLYTHLRLLKQVQPGFWVWVPFYLPLFNKSSQKINNILFRLQFSLIQRILRIPINESMLWISGGFTSLNILHMPFSSKIYQAADLISGFRDSTHTLKKQIREKEAILCQETDFQFAASEKIATGLISLGSKNVHLLHHGVDYEHFSKNDCIHPYIQDIRKLGKPIAGYFGSLSDANDKVVFQVLADGGFSVVIIGKVLGDYKELEQHPNIHFIGPVRYADLPAWAHGFDVGLLNWRPADWIDNCFPVKSLEYLAAGIPVVSCFIPVLQKHFSDVISFANSPDDFLNKCKTVIAEDCESLRHKRMERVKNLSWDKQYEFVKGIIHEVETKKY